MMRGYLEGLQESSRRSQSAETSGVKEERPHRGGVPESCLEAPPTNDLLAPLAGSGTALSNFPVVCAGRSDHRLYLAPLRGARLS